jgi:hypothetical protein
VKKLYERFGEVLDVFLHHQREGRTREAAAVIDALPAEQVRSFAYFCAMHVERDLDQLRKEVRNHTLEIMARDTPSQNLNGEALPKRGLPETLQRKELCEEAYSQYIDERGPRPEPGGPKANRQEDECNPQVRV